MTRTRPDPHRSFEVLRECGTRQVLVDGHALREFADAIFEATTPALVALRGDGSSALEVVASLERVEAMVEDLSEGLRRMFQDTPRRFFVRAPSGPCPAFLSADPEDDTCECGWRFHVHSESATEGMRQALEEPEDVPEVPAIHAAPGPPVDDTLPEPQLPPETYT